MKSAYNIIVWFCATINICFLIVNIRLMICRWFDVKEEAQRHALKAALINQREARKELMQAEKLIQRDWEDV